MRILVISKVSIPAKDRTLPAWEYLRSLGHEVVVEHPDSVPTSVRPDFMISMGVSIMEETFRALERFPGVALACYQWDTYSWVWTRPRDGEYDYKRYGELLRLAKEVWVPSECTGLQARKWWGIESWKVILSACPWWDHPVREKGYALCTLRRLPDSWCPKFEEVCERLKIPYFRTDHQLDREGYEQAVANCKFLVNHFEEASTGGLTLMEGYRLGKRVLCSDSPWNGARDYFGDRAVYFDYTSVEDFEAKLKYMMALEPRTHADVVEGKEWVETNYSDQRMVEDMLRRMEALL